MLNKLKLPSFKLSNGNTHVTLHMPLIPNTANWDVDGDIDSTDGRAVYYDDKQQSWVKVYGGELFSETALNDQAVVKWVGNTEPRMLTFSDRYSCLSPDNGFITLITCENSSVNLNQLEDDLTYKYTFHDASKHLLNQLERKNVQFGSGETLQESVQHAVYMYSAIALKYVFPLNYTDDLVYMFLNEYAQKLNSGIESDV
jgi:hypothetical protein